MEMDKSNQEPPKAMTWPKAMPILVLAGFFDLLRLFFNLFWFFGPAIVAALCTLGANNWLGTTVATTGGKITAAACTAAAGAAGFFGVEVTVPLGTILADAVGLIGFLTLGLWIIISNARLFKVNATGQWWFVGGFGVGQIPLIGSLPVFTFVLYRLYKTQIQVEKDGLKKYNAELAAQQLQERNQKIVELMQMQAAQQEEADI